MPIYWFVRGVLVHLYRFTRWVSYPYRMTIERTDEYGNTVTRCYDFHTHAEMAAFRKEQHLDD